MVFFSYNKEQFITQSLQFITLHYKMKFSLNFTIIT